MMQTLSCYQMLRVTLDGNRLFSNAVGESGRYLTVTESLAVKSL